MTDDTAPPLDFTTEQDDDRSDRIGELVEAVQKRLARRPPFRATYRMQFTAAQFHFDDAAGLADYLSELGVSHVYSSPCLQSRSGSTHGYDIVDHSRLNEELGGAAGFDRFIDAIHSQGLGHLMDIVPNHMSVATHANAWWMDVLMNGPSSPYAAYFDINWHPVSPELSGRVLLPVLGELYGATLEAGRLPILYEDGAFLVACGDLKLPLDPQTYTSVLAPGVEALAESNGPDSPDILELMSILTALQYLPGRLETAPERMAERHRERLVIQGRLRRLMESENEIREHVERNLKALNGTPGDAASFDELDRLLDAQAYRLVHWKAGSDELNYRRFFDVTELAALCTENIEVFQATHRLLFDLAVQGKADGFRVDHIDGLFDPAQYLWRLQWGLVEALGRQEYEKRHGEQADGPVWEEIQPFFLRRIHDALGGPSPVDLLNRFSESADGDPERAIEHSAASPNESDRIMQRPWPLPVLAEKILGVNESLPADWPVEGTTGYDFLNLVGGLFVDSKGLRDIERIYARFVDLRMDLKEIIYACKRLILSASMQSEVQLLAHRLDQLSNRYRYSRDYTLQALRFALREITAYFPVYRTYICGGEVSERDRQVIHLAVAQARRNNPAAEDSVFQFVRDVLLQEQPPLLDEDGRNERDLFVGRFQQVTSPVMAKGVEDTAFYQYVPLSSLEEVGGEPAHALTTIEEFHRQNALRRAEWPQTMLATTTHDTKRTEDVRARIHVLSEISGTWRSALQRWSRWNRKFRRDVEGLPAPSRNDEWLFYQSLLGIWPVSPPSRDERRELIHRLQKYMEKATREAKLRTSWISPNPLYDEAVQAFVANVLEDEHSRFSEDFRQLHESILDSGLFSSLSQTLLKLTAPGVPDLYQGQEVWDFSLVDPDNRRPVDYARRRGLLRELIERSRQDESRRELARELANSPRDDRLKLYVLSTVLRFRKEHPALFDAGDYVPLIVEGAGRLHLCAFARRAEGKTLVVAAPRLIQRLRNDSGAAAPLGAHAWGDSVLLLDRAGEGRRFRNLFTGQEIGRNGGRLPVSELLRDFPAALLYCDHG
jgi:(1->4)-alpha-D-glucan 1-alpha-D-glucosylmutase